MKNEKTLWINVSTSYKWQGPVVGIVRTEIEIVTRLGSYFKGILKLCCWDGNTFQEVSYLDYLSKIDQNVISCSENDKNQQQLLKKQALVLPLLSKREVLKSIAQIVLTLCPDVLRPALNKLLLHSKHALVSYLSKRSLNVNNQVIKDFSEKKENKNKLDLFKSGDLYLSMGLDWNDDVFEYYYSLKKRGIKVFTFCYDTIPILLPQYCYENVAAKFKRYFIELAEASEIIFCISECSKRDLSTVLNKLGARLPRLELIRLGSDIAGRSNFENRRSTSVSEESYILYVSTIERRKNHEVIYKAYHLLRKMYPQLVLPKVVFVGMKGWGVEDLYNDICLDPLTKDYFVFAGRVSDIELEGLYARALFVVFPSLYEGWGLGVVEALSRGKFVLASKVGSLQEAGQEFAEYLDPWSVSDWAGAIYLYSQNLKALEKKEKLIGKLYKPETWGTCCKMISDIIANSSV